METYVALLRGINVGNTRSLPMKDLCRILRKLNFTDIQTYIQSGNVVFRANISDRVLASKKISASIEKEFGFAPDVMLLTATELETTISENPFPTTTSDPKAHHVAFMDTAPPSPDLDKLNELKAPGEQFEIRKNCFYLYAPHGIGRSKLAARLEKSLGVPATLRNWRTVGTLLELAKSCP